MKKGMKIQMIVTGKVFEGAEGGKKRMKAIGHVEVP
jgi:hypothetical protein